MRHLLLIATLLISGKVLTAQVAGDTWSSRWQKIQAVQSYWGYALFQLQDSSSCGTASGDGYWELPMTKNDTALDIALAYKKSILLTAFAANKYVKLRCESGAISDLMVKQGQ